MLTDAQVTRREKVQLEGVVSDLKRELGSLKTQVTCEGNITAKVKADWKARLAAAEEAAEKREAALKAEIRQEWDLMAKVTRFYLSNRNG